MKRHPKKGEAECQTVLQCTPHILRYGDRTVVQSTQYTQTIATIAPEESDTELYPQLTFVDKPILRKDALAVCKARRHRRLKFNLPDLSDEEINKSFSINQEDVSIVSSDDDNSDEFSSAVFESLPAGINTSTPEDSIHTISDPVVFERPEMDDEICQTRLMVFPHFLRRKEIASISTDISIQTSVTCQPTCSITEIIPKLKTYLEHEGREIEISAVSGDSQANRTVLDIIKEIIEDVENSHRHMFDNDFRPPKLPPELQRIKKGDGSDSDLYLTATDDSFANIDCPKCQDKEKQKQSDKVCEAHCSIPYEKEVKPADECVKILEDLQDESFAIIDKSADGSIIESAPAEESFAVVEQAPDESFAEVDHPAEETFIDVDKPADDTIDEPAPVDESFAEVDLPADETIVVVDQPADETFVAVDQPADESIDESLVIIDQLLDESFANLDQPADEPLAMVDKPPPEDEEDKPTEGGDQPKKVEEEPKEDESKCKKDCVCAGFKIKLFINNMGGITDENDPKQKTCIELNVMPGLERIEVKAIPDKVESEEEEEEIEDGTGVCNQECCASKDLQKKFPGGKQGTFILPDGRETTCPAVIYKVTKGGFAKDSEESIGGEIKCICGSTTEEVAGTDDTEDRSLRPSGIVDEIVSRSADIGFETESASNQIVEGSDVGAENTEIVAENADTEAETLQEEAGNIQAEEANAEVEASVAETKATSGSPTREDGAPVEPPAEEEASPKSDGKPKYSFLGSTSTRKRSRKSSKLEEEEPDEEPGEETRPCTCGNEMIKDFDSEPSKICSCAPEESIFGDSDSDLAAPRPVEQPEDVDETIVTYVRVAEEVTVTISKEKTNVEPQFDNKTGYSKLGARPYIQPDDQIVQSETAESEPADFDHLDDQIIKTEQTTESDTMQDGYEIIIESETTIEKVSPSDGNYVESGGEDEGLKEDEQTDESGLVEKSKTAGKESDSAEKKTAVGGVDSCICSPEDAPKPVDIFCQKTRVKVRKSRELLQTQAMSVSNLLDGNIMALVSKNPEGFNIILNIKNPNDTLIAAPGEKKGLPPCKCDPSKPVAICDCSKKQSSPRDKQNMTSDDEYETCSEGPSTSRSRRGQENTDQAPSANAQITLPDNTVLNLRVTLDMKDIEKMYPDKRSVTKKRSAKGIPSETMKNHPSIASTATGIFPHRAPKLYDVGDTPADDDLISKTYLKDVNSFLFTESSRTINILTPSMTSRASYLSTKPVFDPQHPAVTNKDSVSSKKIDQTVSFRTRFRNTIEYASVDFDKLRAPEVLIRNEVRITSSQSMPQIDAGTCTKKTCAFLKNPDKKPCSCQTEGVNAATSSSKAELNKYGKPQTPKSESGQEKPDIVFMAFRACEEELKPITMALNDLKKELKTLNMPEVDCIFGKEPIPDVPKKSFFQQKMRELSRKADYINQSYPMPQPSPVIKLKLTPTASKASQGATGMKTKTRIKFQTDHTEIHTPEIMSRTLYPYSSQTSSAVKQKCSSSCSSKRNADSNVISKTKIQMSNRPGSRSGKNTGYICPQMGTSPKIISKSKIKLPRSGSNTCQNYDSTSNRSNYGGKIMGVPVRTESNTNQYDDSTSFKVYSKTKIKMPQNQSYSNICPYLIPKTKYPQAPSYDYYQSKAGSSRISPRLDLDMQFPQKTNYDSAYNSYQNSSGCNYSGSSFPDQNKSYRTSQTKIRMHMNDKGVQNCPSKSFKTKVRIVSNHSLNPNLSDQEGSGHSSRSNISNVSCVSSEEFVCPSTHPSPPVQRKGKKRKHSSKASCASSNVSVCPFLEAMRSMIGPEQRPKKKGRQSTDCACRR